MKWKIGAIGYALVFGVIVSQVACDHYQLGAIEGFAAWTAAFILSFVPIVRTIAFAVAASFFIPWWLAVPSSIVLSFFRLALVTGDRRAEAMARTKAEMQRFKEERESNSAEADA